jgi:hypothetical protein
MMKDGWIAATMDESLPSTHVCFGVVEEKERKKGFEIQSEVGPFIDIQIFFFPRPKLFPSISNPNFPSMPSSVWVALCLQSFIESERRVSFR